jgi:hypothetical protein
MMSWLALPEDERADLENRVDAVEVPRRWNEVGVRQRLDQLEVIDSQEVCHEILAATGGWPLLLDALFESVKPQSDPRSAAQDFAHHFAEARSQLREQFRLSVGFNAHPSLSAVLMQIVAETHGMPADETGIALLADTAGLSPEECETVVTALRRLSCIELRDGLLYVEPLVRQALPQ